MSSFPSLELASLNPLANSATLSDLSGLLPQYYPPLKIKTMATTPTIPNPLLQVYKYNSSDPQDLPLEFESPKNNRHFADSKLSFGTERRMSRFRIEQFDFGNFQHVKSLIFVLKRTPLSRSPQELEFLAEVFAQIPFFQAFQRDFDRSTYEHLLRNLRYEFGKKDRKVFNFGDMGRKFYIILHGSVSVLLPKEGGESIVTEDNQGKPEFIEVNVLSSGDSFGEIALLNSVPRTATCICKEETHLVVLTAEIYMKIVAQFHRNQRYDLLEILDQTPYFKAWPSELKNVIAIHLKLKVLPMNTVLYEEGDAVKHVYLIKAGEVEISKAKQSGKGDKNPKKSRILDRTKEGIEILDSFAILEKNQPNSIVKGNSSQTTKRSFFERRENPQRNICYLGPFALFGDDELFLELRNRQTKAVVRSTNAAIFEVSARKFKENIPSQFIQELKAANRTRWKWRNSLLKTSQRVTSLLDDRAEKRFYRTLREFKKPAELLEHIKGKNKEVLSNLPATFSFEHRNRTFFKGIEKYYPAKEAERERSDLEKAIFPSTTLIPFKRKLHALALGLRHFRISNELKEKIEVLVHENSLKDLAEKRPEEDYNLDGLFSDYEEVESRDLLAGFKVKGDESAESLSKKVLVKRDNPLITLSQNLNLKLQMIPEKPGSKDQDKDKDLFSSSVNDRKEEKGPKLSSSRTFLPNKRLVESLMKESSTRERPEVAWKPKKGVSWIDVSKVLEQEKGEPRGEKWGRVAIKRRKHVKDLHSGETFYGGDFRRKLVFLTDNTQVL